MLRLSRAAWVDWDWLLALALLVAGILAADDINHTATLDNLAVVAHPLDRCSDFHGWHLSCGVEEFGGQ